MKIEEKPVDSDTVAQIAKKSKVPKLLVGNILKYNVISPKQFAQLFGMSEGTVRTMIRSRKKDGGSTLTKCHPYPNLDKGLRGVGKSGPVFILRDEKFDKWLRNWLRG